MNIIEPTKKQLDDFVISQSGDFQQSWELGEFHPGQYNREIRRYMVIEEGQPKMASSFVSVNLKFGQRYWLCPGGPVVSDPKDIVFLKEVRKKLGGVFVRIEPKIPAENRDQLTELGFISAPKDYSPRATVRVDLNNSEEEMLSAMHQKTRYNINLAARRGIEIKEADDQIDSFIKLLKGTSKRDKFGIHPEEHYKKLMSVPGTNLFLAFLDDVPVAGAIISFFGNEAVYVHGASDYEHRKEMAPYLLHWTIMKEAKRRGMKVYDFRGVAPRDSKNHPWAGITRFKKGFGGEYVEFVGSHDYVMNSFWYTLYKLARKVL